MMRHLMFLLLVVAGPALAAPPVPEDARIAFFGLTWLDTSAEGEIFGEKPEEQARVRLLENMVRDRFEEAGLTFVDTAPVEERLAATVNPAQCYGCDTRMGEELDADYVLVGEIQKVSNLILAMNLQLRAVPGGETIAARSAEIRSNTDDSWRRGMRLILDTAFFQGENE